MQNYKIDPLPDLSLSLFFHPDGDVKIIKTVEVIEAAASLLIMGI